MKPSNHYKEWTKQEDDYIRESAKSGISTKEIADKLKRTEDSVRERAHVKSISLKPIDK